MFTGRQLPKEEQSIKEPPVRDADPVKGSIMIGIIYLLVIFPETDHNQGG